MILKSVKLRNIRSYLNEKVEFPTGSVVLSGDIGSGKSSILHAVEFALFGILNTDIGGESLLRHGKNEGGVELKFQVKNKEYVIKRKLKRRKDSVGQASGYIIKNGKKKEGTAIELKSQILNILGYPNELLHKRKNLIFR